MKEEFLHYLWKFKKYAFAKAKTTTGQTINFTQVGQHNHFAGPDFTNAIIAIDGQTWAGNVEIHIKSSDWYAHNHEKDPAYDNVILHVVWEHDIEIYRKDNSVIPTLVLKELVTDEALARYYNLFSNIQKKWINCEKDLNEVPAIIQNNWLERLYFERLENKTEPIKLLIKELKYDWEAALFAVLMRSFGTKINGASFYSIARHIDFTIIRKVAQEPFQLEALLLGLGGLLPEDTTDSYVLQLQGEYDYLKKKFKINSNGILPVQFFKLRPDNFPTIRLSQVSQLYFKEKQLFQKLMFGTLSEIYETLNSSASVYWDTHFSFGATQKARKKKLSKSFIDLIIINTIIPLRFLYGKHRGADVDDEILSMIQHIKPEFNSIVKKFNLIRDKAQNAQETQSLLELKSQYCDLHKCLQCANGNYLIGK